MAWAAWKDVSMKEYTLIKIERKPVGKVEIEFPFCFKRQLDTEWQYIAIFEDKQIIITDDVENDFLNIEICSIEHTEDWLLESHYNCQISNQEFNDKLLEVIGIIGEFNASN